MPPVLMPAVLHETQPKVGPYGYQEWITKGELRKLTAGIHSLLAGMPEFFRSDVATSSGEITKTHDFWKTPVRYVQVSTNLATETGTQFHKAYEEDLLAFQRSMRRVRLAPDMIQEEDMLDWDAHIETPPPPHRSGTIKVRFKYVGRSKPIPITDPWA